MHLFYYIIIILYNIKLKNLIKLKIYYYIIIYIYYYLYVFYPLNKDKHFGDKMLQNSIFIRIINLHDNPRPVG